MIYNELNKWQKVIWLELFFPADYYSAGWLAWRDNVVHFTSRTLIDLIINLLLWQSDNNFCVTPNFIVCRCRGGVCAGAHFRLLFDACQRMHKCDFSSNFFACIFMTTFFFFLPMLYFIFKFIVVLFLYHTIRLSFYAFQFDDYMIQS